VVALTGHHSKEAQRLTTAVVSGDAHVRNSLALLLRMHRGFAVEEADFERRYDDPDRDTPHVVMIDVREDRLQQAEWFARRLY
jgi:hypothetical protein